MSLPGSAINTAGDTVAQSWSDNTNGALGGSIAPNEAFYDEAPTPYSGTGSQTSNASAPNYSAYSVGTAMDSITGETLGHKLSNAPKLC